MLIHLYPLPFLTVHRMSQLEGSAGDNSIFIIVETTK